VRWRRGDRVDPFKGKVQKLRHPGGEFTRLELDRLVLTAIIKLGRAGVAANKRPATIR